MRTLDFITEYAEALEEERNKVKKWRKQGKRR